uniref:7TM GPCR serpentine receptor class x (Srx) domain-containing protein n=1 Tax=Ditylenchus dipsaci TaxID=166011 RepID=A0A915ERD4_9BILA
MFKIDFRDGAPPVIDWICFWNCAWVVCSLLVLYSLLYYRLKRKSEKYANEVDNKKSCKIQNNVMLQSFLICFFVFIVATCYAVAGFIHIPNRLTKFATIAVQICSGFTSIVYLVINKEIRKSVKRMFFVNTTVHSTANTSMTRSLNNASTVKQHSQIEQDSKYA